MYNELKKGHLHITMDNAIAIGVDDIVILDDGSDDGSWRVLKEYAEKYDHIRIYRNDKNSVLSEGKNRWKFIVDKIAEKTPDWIVIRAADQIYSYQTTIEGGDHFRKRLFEFYHKGIEMVEIPLVHIWRSNTWYRADNVWGQEIRTHSKRPIWRFNPNYTYKRREKTGAHLGWHHPSNFGIRFPLKKAKINSGAIDSWDLVVIHLGHSTHESKVLKFEWSMEAARVNAKNNRSSTMPPPDRMPPVKHWISNRFRNNDGYKGFYEFGMVLKQAPKRWFSPGTDFSEEEPVPKSLFPIINKYNERRAEEYKKLYNKYYGSMIKNKKKKYIYEGEIS
ncbi:MAG: glycosyltransferase [Campylobacterota bacterium]|nr:glycosyltransferase [Campylobacterota bacterium]